MTVLGDSGALAGANLAVNILIAIGTIGAAGVALWLGIRAQRAGGAQAREARMKQTRQIVSVYNLPEAGIPASVEVVNASPEVVTRLLVEVHASIGVGDARQDLLWEWTDETLRARWPTVSYLLAGQSAKLLGAFTVKDRLNGPTASLVAFSGDVDPHAVQVVVTWDDSYGETWAKRGGGEAFPTSWAAPWRDSRNFMPRWAWPAHWPPQEPNRRREPLRERLVRRWHRFNEWLSLRWHRFNEWRRVKTGHDKRAGHG